MSTPKPLHIFRAGTHTTMAGETIAFSEADLVAIASAYDPARHKAPLVLGHPASDDPAQGWVAGLVAQGAHLFALPEKIAPAFAEDARAGRWGAVSAAFYRPADPGNPIPGRWYLRHVGVLGAQPPAVKGLLPPEFAEAACFAEAFTDQAPTDDSTTEPAMTQATPGTATPDATQLAASNAQLAAHNAELQRQLAAATAATNETKRRAVHDQNAAFCETQIKAGRMTPAQQPVAIALLNHLALAEKPVQFQEADGQTVDLLAAAKKLFEAAPKVVAFGEHATTDRASKDPRTVNPLLADAERRATPS